MTRKDYIVIAQALALSRPSYFTVVDYQDDPIAQWNKDRNSIAAALAADNPRFDRARFIAATEGPQ